MGVSKFFTILLGGKEIKEFGTETTIEKLSKGKEIRLCIDADYIIYSAILAFTLQDGDKLTTQDGKITIHINTILNKVLQLSKNRVQQVWIFDSPKPNQMKAKEAKKRAELKAKSQDPRGKFRLTSDQIREVQTLLSLMGVCWVEAPQGIEAEQYGAWMTRGQQSERFCQYMISGDSDVLMFGGSLMRPIKRKSQTGKSSKTMYSIFEIEDLLEKTKTTQGELVKIGVVMGTDFNESIRGIGVKTVEKKVKSGNIDEKFGDEHREAMQYFLSDISQKVGMGDLHLDKYNEEKLIKFLQERNFNAKKIQDRLKTYKTW